MDVFIAPQFGQYYEQHPLVLVDIGASGGLQKHWKPARKHLRVIGFEPDQRAYSDLINSAGSKSTEYLNIGVYKEKASLDFYLARKQEVSSMFKPNRGLLDRFPEPERFDILETVQIDTDSLDNQFREHQIKNVDFIKMDAQGSELYILQGAEGLLRDTVVGLEIEVAFAETYEGQPLFQEVDSFVKGFGFELFDLRPGYWKRSVGMHCGNPKGQIIFADALYLKRTQALTGVLDQIHEEALKRSKALRAISICILYGYLDYALEYFEATSSLFSEQERQAVVKKFTKEVALSSRIPHFRGKGRVADALYGLWQIMQPTHQGWAIVGKVLGNRR